MMMLLLVMYFVLLLGGRGISARAGEVIFLLVCAFDYQVCTFRHCFTIRAYCVRILDMGR